MRHGVCRRGSVQVPARRDGKSQHIELLKEGGSGKPKDFPRRMEIKCSKYKNYYRSFCLKTIPISRDFGAYAKAFLCQPFLKEKHHVYKID